MRAGQARPAAAYSAAEAGNGTDLDRPLDTVEGTAGTTAPGERLLRWMPLVRQLAQQIHATLPPGVERDELIGWGLDGLLSALERFDPERGMSFVGYARIRIRGAILDQLRTHDFATRTMRQKATRLERSARRIEARLGRPAAVDELASEMGLSLEALHDLRCEVGDLGMVSLDELGSGQAGEMLGYEELLAAQAGDPVAALFAEERARAVSEALLVLSPRERLVLPLYYQADLTMREVGERLGITESRVSQLHSHALARLRDRLAPRVDDLLPA